MTTYPGAIALLDHADNPVRLILASSSPYRAATLTQLQWPFTQQAPNVDESPQPDEESADLARRLAIMKAQAIAPSDFPAVVIGSDQTGVCGTTPLTKPGSLARAVDMLLQLQGSTAVFHSAVATVYWDHSGAPQPVVVTVIDTLVQFRRFTRAQLQRYVDIDETTQCAGAFKVEQLGIVLFEKVASEDPSALIGLPAIALSHMLMQYGIDPIPVQNPVADSPPA